VRLKERESVGEAPRRESVGEASRRESVGEAPRRESVGEASRRQGMCVRVCKVCVGGCVRVSVLQCASMIVRVCVWQGASWASRRRRVCACERERKSE